MRFVLMQLLKRRTSASCKEQRRGLFSNALSKTLLSIWLKDVSATAGVNDH